MKRLSIFDNNNIDMEECFQIAKKALNKCITKRNLVDSVAVEKCIENFQYIDKLKSEKPNIAKQIANIV